MHYVRNGIRLAGSNILCNLHNKRLSCFDSCIIHNKCSSIKKCNCISLANRGGFLYGISLQFYCSFPRVLLEHESQPFDARQLALAVK